MSPEEIESHLLLVLILDCTKSSSVNWEEKLWEWVSQCLYVKSLQVWGTGGGLIVTVVIPVIYGEKKVEGLQGFMGCHRRPGKTFKIYSHQGKRLDIWGERI